MGRPIQKKWFGEITDPPEQIIVSGAKFADGTTTTNGYIVSQTGSSAYMVQDAAKAHAAEILFMVNADSVDALMPGQCFIIATPFGGTALPCKSIEQHRVKVYNIPNSTPRRTGDPAVSSASSYEWVIGPTTRPGQATLIPSELPPVGQPAILTFNILSREAGDVSLNFAGVGMDIHIDWGDGITPERFATWPQVHTYTEPGVYNVTVNGNAILWTETDIKDKLTEVSTFGELPLISLNGAYAGQTSLTTVPSILPSSVTNISNMFSGCTSFNEDLSGWDVSNITDMSGTFEGATSFNGNISNWNTINVTDMSSMFNGATSFNQDLSSWVVSNVTNFDMMFKNATSFNQDVMSWNTVNATAMEEMFNGATAYGATQDLTGWQVPNVPPADIDDPFAAGSLLPRDKYPGYVAPTGAELTYDIILGKNVSLNLSGIDLNITIDWGDGSAPETFITSPQTHTYAANGTYNVSITGNATTWGQPASSGKMTAITSWGNLPLVSLTACCSGEWQLVSVPSNIPLTVTDTSQMFNGARAFNGDISTWVVSNVTDMNNMFNGASVFNGDISGWNVSSVTNMNNMFNGASLFNSDISGWDVSSVTDMSNMFGNADRFNRDLSAWDVSNVTDMSYMFYGADRFNQDLSAWDVSSVTNMNSMFVGARAFNGDISSWDVSNVTDMRDMFNSAAAFNGDISGWDVSSVTDMTFMFCGANAFNQDLSAWDVSSVTGMSSMFNSADAFNGDISTWNVSSVTGTASMFYDALAFNQDLSAWDVSNVTNMSFMFYNAAAFNSDISTWNVSSVTDMSYMFSGASLFNGDISAWDVSSVTNMSNMFYNARAFNQDLSAWDVSSVTNMSNMFYNSDAFNGDISTWDVSSVTNMSNMFQLAVAFNGDISGWDVSSVTNMSDMFNTAPAFNGNVMPWNTANVTYMSYMFNGATAYGATQDLTGWNVALVPPEQLGDSFAENSMLPRDKYPGYVAP